MNGFSLKVSRGNTPLSLATLLILIRHHILALKWKVKIEETEIGPAASEIEAIRPNELVDTLELLHAVSPNVQIIDGEFDGYDVNGCIVLRIRAVDGVWWDIETDSAPILRTIIEKFPDAIDLPGS